MADGYIWWDFRHTYNTHIKKNTVGTNVSRAVVNFNYGYGHKSHNKYFFFYHMWNLVFVLNQRWKIRNQANIAHSIKKTRLNLDPRGSGARITAMLGVNRLISVYRWTCLEVDQGSFSFSCRGLLLRKNLRYENQDLLVARQRQRSCRGRATRRSRFEYRRFFRDKCIVETERREVHSG